MALSARGEYQPIENRTWILLLGGCMATMEDSTVDVNVKHWAQIRVQLADDEFAAGLQAGLSAEETIAFYEKAIAKAVMITAAQLQSYGKMPYR